MLFLLQVVLYLLMGAVSVLIVRVLHGSIWQAGIGSIMLLIAAFIGYTFWQARHPKWQAPWSRHLSPVGRVLDLILPVLIAFILTLVLAPRLLQARENAQWNQKLSYLTTGKGIGNHPLR